MLWLLSLYNVLSALPRTLEETCWKLTWKASMAVFRVRLQSQNSNDLLVGEEGEQVGCHALLLAAVSHLLRSILPQTPDQDEEIGDKFAINATRFFAPHLHWWTTLSATRIKSSSSVTSAWNHFHPHLFCKSTQKLSTQLSAPMFAELATKVQHHVN